MKNLYKETLYTVATALFIPAFTIYIITTLILVFPNTSSFPLRDLVARIAEINIVGLIFLIEGIIATLAGYVSN